MDILIRPIKRADYSKLKPLLDELGYPSTVEDVTNRFIELQKHSDYEGIVSIKNNQIVAFAGVCKAYYFEMTGKYTRILAFIVSSKERQQGIGTELLKSCEQWAINQGCNAITLNSGNREERQIAHNFYKGNGYIGKSTGFVKRLT